MYQVKIVCVGKLKERFYADACAEYEKRLRRYMQLDIVELPDEKAPERLSSAQLEQVKNAEGARILSKISPKDRVAALCIDGREIGSAAWAHELERAAVQGQNALCLVIGGSNGLSPSVLARADQTLSFSRFTFSHQLMRVILLEQLYRAMKILAGEPYHK